MRTLPPLYQVGQVLYMRRSVNKNLLRGARVKIKSVWNIVNGYRYEVEFAEEELDWCYEFDLTRKAPA